MKLPFKLDTGRKAVLKESEPEGEKALKKLDTIVPGVLHPSTIMYYPEIKLYANKPQFIDEYFMAAQDVYLIGAGAGTSRGITGAWASGMRAADGILRRQG